MPKQALPKRNILDIQGYFFYSSCSLILHTPSSVLAFGDDVVRKQMIDFVRLQTGLSEQASRVFLSLLFGQMEKSLLAGDKVRLPEIGILCIAPTKARVGRNLQTGTAVEIPAALRLKIAPTERLKKKLKDMSDT
jgi:nucleoid DNA-binding protein